MDYQIVKYCIMCRKRFLVEKGQRRTIYCPECQKKVDKSSR